MASLIIFVFLLPYSASVYKGLGGMFQRAFGFDYAWCVTAIALLSAVYLFAGGYRATAVTDFIPVSYTHLIRSGAYAAAGDAC